MPFQTNRVFRAARSFPPGKAGLAARTLCGCLATAGFLCAEPAGAEQETRAYEHPAFVGVDSSAVHPTRVHDIVSTEVTDLVMLPAGADAGYRPGMVCRVTRDGEAVAEILLVEVREHVAAAIIVGIFPDQLIQTGDAVRVKTVQQ